MRNIKLVKEIKYAGLELSLVTDKGSAPIIPVYLCDTNYVAGVGNAERIITTITFTEEEIASCGDKFGYSDFIIVVGKKFMKYSNKSQMYLIYREYLNSASIDLSKYNLPVLADTDLEMVSENDLELMRDAITLAKFGRVRKMIAESKVNKLKKRSVKSASKVVKENTKTPEDGIDGFYADGIPLKVFEESIKLSDDDKKSIVKLVDLISDMIDSKKSKKDIIQLITKELKTQDSMNVVKFITVITTTDIISNATKIKILKYFDDIIQGFNFKTVMSMM